MKLGPRLTLFTVTLVLLVVTLTSVSTILALRYFLRVEMRANQLTWFANFREACDDALHLGDDLAIQAASESLERSVPEVGFAVFEDTSRGGILLGGIESLHRFEKVKPTCPASEKENAKGAIPAMRDFEFTSPRWRVYCKSVSRKNVRGDDVEGVVYLGFNLDTLELRLSTLARKLWTTLASTMVLVLILGVVLAYILSRRLVRPILQLTEGAKAIGEGQLDTQIAVRTRDELGFLAEEFNLMAVKLKELDQLKDDFVSSVSHELRSPLAAISGYIELLLSKPLSEIAPEKQSKALQIIQESTQRLAHFINEILDLAKIKAGQVEIRPKSFDLKKMIEDVDSLFQALVEKKNIYMTVDVPDNAREVIADEDKIRQVLTNLISNALKFTPSQGKIRIAARNESEFIQISVSDTGAGIPEESLETIFERFKQASNSAGDFAQKGTGLGLAIARGIVEAHSGQMWVESEVGKGATFHFTIPVTPFRKS